MTNVEIIKDYIRLHQSPKRFLHTCGVAGDCVQLSEIFDFSPEKREKLETAGWLHDITKELSAKEQEQLCKEFGIPVPLRGYSSPVLHSYTGAYFARKVFPDIVDDEIFSAIHSHTTGKSNMTLFDMLVCFADYTEPSRKYEGCKRLRHKFYSGVTPENRFDLLKECIIESFDMTITSLIKNGDIIDPDTFSARNSLLETVCSKVR